MKSFNDKYVQVIVELLTVLNNFPELYNLDTKNFVDSDTIYPESGEVLTKIRNLDIAFRKKLKQLYNEFK